MDIGTAKLTLAERGGVPHHLLDVWTCASRRPSPTTSGWRAPRSTGCARPASSRAGRRLGALRAGRPRRPRLPGHRRRRPGPAGGRARRRRRRPALHERLAGARPGRGRGDPAEQRPPDRARAGGHRAHRPPLPRLAARAAPALPGRGRRAGPRPGRARRADRACGWTGCGRPGFVDEVAAPGRRRAAGGPDGVAGAGLRPGAGAARRRADAGRGARADGRGPPGGSCAGSGPGSAATRPHWFDAAAPTCSTPSPREIAARTIER